MNKLIYKNIYAIFIFINIIFLYMSKSNLYSQDTNYIYNENLINNLPNYRQFVNNIRIKISSTNNSMVIIEWEGVIDDNLTYYIYRSETPIIGKYSLKSAKVIDYIKATNISTNYTTLDMLILPDTYYYAIVSYIGDISFYNAKYDIDTSYIIFKGFELNNNLSNSYLTNNIQITNIGSNSTVNNNIENTNNITQKNTNNINEYTRYNNEYKKALYQFSLKSYSLAINILEPISVKNIDNSLYYNINLILGQCYKYLGQKKKALDTFNCIKKYNEEEINFWINQVLIDL